jgi:hypothetical protein
MLKFLVSYILALGAFIFVLLFGECTAFEGTVVAKAHTFLQDGLPAALSKGVVLLCGQTRGRRCLDSASEVCLDRPNPALQARVHGAHTRRALQPVAARVLTQLCLSLLLPVRVHLPGHRRLCGLPHLRVAAHPWAICVRGPPVRARVWSQEAGCSCNQVERCTHLSLPMTDARLPG